MKQFFNDVLIQVFNVHPDAVEPVVIAFLKSMKVTGTALLPAIIAAMYADNALASEAAALTWLHTKLWPFVIAQLLAPTIRGYQANRASAPK